MKYLLLTFFIFIFTFLSFSGWYIFQVYYRPHPVQIPTSFSITPKESASSIIFRLSSAKLISSPLAVKIYLRLNNVSQKLKPGGYQISPGLSPKQIIDLFVTGPKDVWVTIPEGWRREQIAQRLKSTLVDFNDREFITLSASLEGRLFPDTYLIPTQAEPSVIINIFSKNFAKKTANLPALTQDQIILASLIEREAKTDPDRAIIAGIISKRQKAGWPLQIDASIQYALGRVDNWWPDSIDTRFPSPYNTYIYPGLPPAPICNPGLASITAVVNPTISPYWFYLSAPDGTTYYASTLAQHNLNIDKYLRP